MELLKDKNLKINVYSTWVNVQYEALFGLFNDHSSPSRHRQSSALLTLDEQCSTYLTWLNKYHNLNIKSTIIHIYTHMFD